MSEKLTKSERLRGEKRIEALFRTGRRGSVGVVRFCFFVTPKSPRCEGGVSVLFSVPKKNFRRAHDRNLLKRRMRESYRVRKGVLADAAAARGVRLDIALICSPVMPKIVRDAAERAAKNAPRPRPEIPDFKSLDNAIERILEQIAGRL